MTSNNKRLFVRKLMCEAAIQNGSHACWPLPLVLHWRAVKIFPL